jgi:glycosyltransferase involved in cell wall biosynthesis
MVSKITEDDPPLTDKEGSDIPVVLNFVVSTPENREGAVRAGLLLGEHLKSQVDVDVVKMEGTYDDELAEALNVEFSTVRPHRGVRNFCNRIFDSSQNYANTFLWFDFDPPRSITEYDIIHIHNSVPLLGMIQIAVKARFHNVPYCVTTHGISKIPDLPEQMEMSWPVRKGFQLGYLHPYYRVLKYATHLFALSNQDAESLRTLFPGQSISVVSNGVQSNPTGSSNNSSSLVNSIPPRYLLFVGKIRRSKGVADILTAYKNIKSDISLVVVGPPQNDILVEELEATDNVHYVGYVDKETLNSLYNNADLFVFPTRSDVFPLVTLEAMAAATPVVATNIGGIPEQITDDVGVIIPPEDPIMLSNTIEDLLNSPQVRKEMGQQAVKRVEKEFSWNSVADQVASQYREIIY